MRMPVCAALFITALNLLMGCKQPLKEDCGLRELASANSPENGGSNSIASRAQVIEEDCGATIANVTSVRLVDLGGKPLGEDGGKVFSVYHGRPTMHLTWNDAQHLHITCKDCKPENVFLQVVKRNFTSVSYDLAQEAN